MLEVKMRLKEQKDLIQKALDHPEMYTTEEILYMRKQLDYVRRQLAIKKWRKWKSRVGFGNPSETN